MWSAARTKELSIAKNKMVTKMTRATMNKAFTKQGLRKGQTPKGCKSLENLITKWPELVEFYGGTWEEFERLRTCDYYGMTPEQQGAVNQECKALFTQFRKVIEFGDAGGHVQTQLNVPKNIISDLNELLRFMRDQQGKQGGPDGAYNSQGYKGAFKPHNFPQAGSTLPSDVVADASKEEGKEKTGAQEEGETGSAKTWAELADAWEQESGHRPETQAEYNARHERMKEEKARRAAEGLWNESKASWETRYNRQRDDAIASHAAFKELLEAAGTSFEDNLTRDQRKKIIMMWAKHHLDRHNFSKEGDADYKDYVEFYKACWSEQLDKMDDAQKKRAEGRDKTQAATLFKFFKEKHGYKGESRWVEQEANIDYLCLLCYVLISAGVTDPKEVIPVLNSLALIAREPMGNNKIKEAMEKCHRSPKVQLMTSKIDFDREGMYQKYASPMLITPQRFMNGVGIYHWAATPMNLLEALLVSPPERAAQILVIFWRLDKHYEKLGLNNAAMFASTHVAHKLFVGVSAGAYSGNRKGKGTEIKFQAIEDLKSNIPDSDETRYDPECLKEFLDTLVK